MKRTVLILLTGAVAGYAAGWWFHKETTRERMPEGILTSVPEGEGWQNLLSEPWLNRWSNTEDDEDIFEISDGMLHIYGISVKLRYAGLKDDIWDDFDLHVEYNLAPGTNSGIFLRWPADTDAHRGFEIQVLDDHGQEPSPIRSGAIYDVVSPMFNMSFPAGEWNSMDISVRGDHVVVVHNGWKVVDTNLGQMTMPIGKFDVPFAEYAKEGYITFQDHGGEVWYRNIYIRDAAPETTAEEEPEAS